MTFIQRNRSVFIILVVALLLALWIASGVLLREPPQLPERAEPQPMRVAVELSHAEQVESLLTLQGEVLPDQQVTIRAETAARVEALPVALGDQVEVGTLIARLSEDDRPARIRQAEARLKGAESEYRAAQRLADSGFQGQLRAEQAEAELAAARAALESARLDLARTQIRAPIAGVVNRQIAQVGNYVAAGDPLAELVENHPLRAVVQVPQHQVQQLRRDAPARVRLLSSDPRLSEPLAGHISHISALADTTTRTFRVEIELPNPQREHPSGTSAQIEIPLREVMAHRISPALIALDDEGELGIKVVDEDDRVAFVRLQPVRADVHGLWAAGLPETIRLITVGQGFVSPGEQVVVVNQGVQ